LDRPHGLAGAVKASIYNLDSQLIQPGRVLQIGASANSSNAFTVRTVTPTPKQWLIELDGVNDVDAAKELAGLEIWVEKSKLAKLPQGEYYHHELVGLRVLDATGKERGSVRAVGENVGADYLEVDVTGKIFCVPLTRDAIATIDLTKKIIQLTDMEGLLDDSL